MTAADPTRDPDERAERQPALQDDPRPAGHATPQSPLRIQKSVVILLLVGGVVALLIFWFEPPFTLRYVVVGILAGLYVLFRFNSWR